MPELDLRRKCSTCKRRANLRCVLKSAQPQFSSPGFPRKTANETDSRISQKNGQRKEAHFSENTKPRISRPSWPFPGPSSPS